MKACRDVNITIFVKAVYYMEKKGNITIKDIAKELGISPSTVSRALKDHPDISEETKTAVKELAKKYHYRPNKMAMGLRMQESKIIGVIIPQVVHFFFSSVISGIEKVANEAGYNVLICQSDDTYEREVNNVAAFLESRVDGVLVSVSKDTTQIDHFNELIDDGIPLVFFDRYVSGVNADHVIVDDAKGAFYATEHLIQEGCKRIAHLAAPQNLLIGKERRRGYVEALDKYNIPVDENLIIKCDSREEALVVVHELMSMKNPPDGIFAVNDLTASGAMRTVKNFGYKVPEDIAIVGFSDGLVANVTDPPLSTVEQHGLEIGITSAKLLLERIAHPDIDFGIREKVIETKLIIRGSSKRS